MMMMLNEGKGFLRIRTGRLSLGDRARAGIPVRALQLCVRPSLLGTLRRGRGRATAVARARSTRYRAARDAGAPAHLPPRLRARARICRSS